MKRKPRKIKESTWAEIRTAYASGIGLREIARNMGIAPGTVLSRAKREGWTRQIQSAKALAVRPREEPPAIAVSDAVAHTMAERGQRHVERMADVVERGVSHAWHMEGAEVLDSVDAVEKLDKVARRTFGLTGDEGSPVQVNILGQF